MSLGEQISTTRKSKGISQEQLAENTGVSLRTIQRIEKDAVQPRPYTLKVIADSLQVSVEQITKARVENVEESAELILKRINVSALAGLICPLLNIFIPIIIWRKSKELPLINSIGRRIISFQIFWTLGSFLFIVLYQFIHFALTGSAQIGRFPTVLFIYCLLLTANVAFIIHASVQLYRKQTSIYSFIPSLF